jgi:hypothetical protein
VRACRIHNAGGSPKNFLLQIAPQIQRVVGVKEAGHDYFLQFTDAQPLLMHYALASRNPRRLKRLYDRRNILMRRVIREYLAYNPDTTLMAREK